MDSDSSIGQNGKVIYLQRPEPVDSQVPSTQSAAALPKSTLGAMLMQVRKESGSAVLMMLRIREYRELVESFGSGCGDQLDREIRRRLDGNLRGSDPVLPLGGGDYAVVLASAPEKAEIDRVCGRLLRSCDGHYQLADFTPRVSIAIGLSFFPVDACRVEEVVRFANIALRRAAAAEGSGFCYFSQEMLKRQRHKLWMDGELRRALDEDRFVLHYQPQYTLDSNEIVAVEALVRMRSQDGTLIPPNDFISIAEENGFIVELGEWVINEACRQLAAWRAAGCGPRRIAVNVSPRQMRDSQLLHVVDRAIRRTGLGYQDIELEVTESSLLQHLPNIGELLRQFRNRGVRVAIDDFGAGYSCFATLAQLPLDTFKLDRSFMSNIIADPRARQVVTAMIAMVRELGYEIVAEGIETDQHYWFMQASGCHLVQGYGLARPQDAQAVSELLQACGAVAQLG